MSNTEESEEDAQDWKRRMQKAEDRMITRAAVKMHALSKVQLSDKSCSCRNRCSHALILQNLQQVAKHVYSEYEVLHSQYQFLFYNHKMHKELMAEVKDKKKAKIEKKKKKVDKKKEKEEQTEQAQNESNQDEDQTEQAENESNQEEDQIEQAENESNQEEDQTEQAENESNQEEEQEADEECEVGREAIVQANIQNSARLAELLQSCVEDWPLRQKDVEKAKAKMKKATAAPSKSKTLLINLASKLSSWMHPLTFVNCHCSICPNLDSIYVCRLALMRLINEYYELYVDYATLFCASEVQLQRVGADGQVVVEEAGTDEAFESNMAAVTLTAEDEDQLLEAIKVLDENLSFQPGKHNEMDFSAFKKLLNDELSLNVRI